MKTRRPDKVLIPLQVLKTDAPKFKLITDENLVALVLKKRRTGAEALYDKYHKGLSLAIVRIAPDKISAEVALEQTFITIWHTMASYNPQVEKVFTFMIRIAREQAILAIKLKY